MRVTYVGVGMDHDTLVGAAEKAFVRDQPIWDKKPDISQGKPTPIDRSIAQYTGGIHLVSKSFWSCFFFLRFIDRFSG